MSGPAADAELQRKVEEYRARERIYLAGLIEQEAGINRLRRTASDVLGAYGDVSRASVRGALVDPTANMEVLALRQKAREKDRQISDLREELAANKFDQTSPAGQILMRKCRALLEENKDLGEQVHEGRVSELRGSLQAEQRQNAELQQKCQEASDFCKELTQENDKLLGTIAKVAGKLCEVKAELAVVSAEKQEWKSKRKRERAETKAAQAAATAQQTADAVAAGGGDALMAVATAASLGGEAALFAAVASRGPDGASSSAPPPVMQQSHVADGVVDLEAAPTPPAGEKVEKEKKRKRKSKLDPEGAPSG